MAAENLTGLGLTDEPITTSIQNSLGIESYVDALSTFIAECQTPMTLSIQGDWGSGKTSVMNLVQEKLGNIPNKKIETLKFNTWQFSQFDMQNDLPISLLKSFSRQLGDFGKDALKQIAMTKVLPILGKITNFFTGGEGGDIIDKIISKLTDTDLDASTHLTKLKDSIKSGVQAKLAKQKADRMVVFIDDLDRLLPEKAVELLEVIKLFLDIEKCVFVLAVDYNVVAKGLEKKFGVSIKDLNERSFFDKIIQLPFNLPVAQYDMKSYLDSLLASVKFENYKEELDLYIRLARNSIGFNPRSMKRLFNSLQLLKMVAQSKNLLKQDEVAGVSEKQRILFAILCMQTSFEGLYRYLIKHSDKLSAEFFAPLKDSAALGSDDYRMLREELKLPNEDAVKKMSEFMIAFYEAIQLKSDNLDEEGEQLSDNEIINLRSLLSFSSLTTSNAGGIKVSAESNQYGYVANRLSAELNEKYQKERRMLSFEFSPDIQENAFNILSDIKIGLLVFKLVAYYNATHYGIEFWDIGPYYAKQTTGDWVKRYLQPKLPSIEINYKKTYGFIGLWKKSRETRHSEENNEKELADFRENIFRVYDLLFQDLLEFYEKRRMIIEQIQSLVDRLEDRCRQEFADEDGWKVESNMRLLGRFSGLKIHHKDWQKKIFLYLENEGIILNNLYIGLKRGQARVQFKDGAEERLKALFEDKFGHAEKTDWWIALQYLNDAQRNITRNSFVADNFTYLLDNSQKEEEFIATIVNKFKAMKELKYLIDELTKE